MTDTTVIAPAKIARKPVAEHEYVDEQGNELPEDALQPEEAQGYTYTLKKTGDAFSWFWKEANDDERRMLALFGVKTLATNETSQVRNADKSVDSSAAQMEALKARFALIRTGTWVDREREGGVRVDKDKLAEAIANVLVAQGKTTDLAATVVAKRAQLEADPGYLRKARQVPEVSQQYAALMGRDVPTVDAL